MRADLSDGRCPPQRAITLLVPNLPNLPVGRHETVKGCDRSRHTLPRAGNGIPGTAEVKTNGAARLLMTAAPFGIYCPHKEPVEA